MTTDSFAPGDLYLMYDLNYPDYYGSEYTTSMQQWYLSSAYNLDWSVNQLTAFAQDTITTGRFNIMLGVRFDHQTPYINSSAYSTVNNNPVWSQYYTSDVAQALYAFMPGMIVPNISPDYHWNVWSPRLGITYDLFGNGKTVLKLSGSMYGDFMGTGSAAYLFNPYGASGAWMYWWVPNSSNTYPITADQMYFTDPLEGLAPYPLIVNGAINPQFVNDAHFYWWGGFTPGSTTPGPSPYSVNPSATSSRTWELLFSLDHELMPNFSVGLNATYRKYNHFAWDATYYANGPYGDYSIDGVNTILGPGAYLPAGIVPTSVVGTDGNTYNMGAGAGRTYYLLSSPYTGTPYYYHTLNTNYETYWGIDLTFNKRLSNKWMLDGSITYQDQKMHYGNGYTDPSNLWALQDQLYAPLMGGASGKINQYIFSHWMVKLEGLYQLPLGFDASFTFNARAGHIIPQYMYITDYTWTDVNPVYYGTNPTYLGIFGNLKLPTFYQLNLRVEKMIKLFDTGRIFLMADLFNVTNAAIINRRYDQRLGTLYVYGKDEAGNVTDYVFKPYALDYVVNEILNPFIARFGVRFQF